MCSYGGKIVPSPRDNNTLLYLGGETKLITISKAITFSSLHSKLSKISTSTSISIKYQLPDQPLDALVTLASDEDVEIMMDAMEKNRCKSKSRRVRVFLIENKDGIDFSEENWFLDGLERERSEASSVVSEVPDYLTGLDSPVEPDLKCGLGFCETVSWDMGSPDPGVVNASLFVSAPVAQPGLNMEPIMTKPESPAGLASDQKGGGLGSGPWEMRKLVQASDKYLGTGPARVNFPGQGYQGIMSRPVPMPVYYVPSLAPPPLENAQIRPVPVPNLYVQQYHVPSSQVLMGFHPMVPSFGPTYGTPMQATYGGSMWPAALDPYLQARVVGGGRNQPLYYGANNSSMFTPGNQAPVSAQGIRNSSWML